MSRKKRNKRYVISSQQIFDAAKPKYNGFGGGYGAHGDKKYNRTREKRAWRKDAGNEE